VPANARIWFDGDLTHQTGPVRDFESPPLQPGQTYTYNIRARWMQNGQPVTQDRTVTVAGQRTMVDFMNPNGTGGNMGTYQRGYNPGMDNGRGGEEFPQQGNFNNGNRGNVNNQNGNLNNPNRGNLNNENGNFSNPNHASGTPGVPALNNTTNKPANNPNLQNPNPNTNNNTNSGQGNRPPTDDNNRPPAF
jgi:uncharacterized protein (TIGR03000 family)